MRKINLIYTLLTILMVSSISYAGNDEKRGQAGATELLVNPWAKTNGWAGAYSGGIRGIESMNLNVAGLAGVRNTELAFSHIDYLSGSDIGFNTVGLGKAVGENGGVFGLTFSSINWGDFEETTTDLPEGTGQMFQPTFINISVAYAKKFSKSINGGLALRLVSESIKDASATGVTIDAGVQYQSGDRNQFQFGVALRNVGPKMKFSGDGLAYRATIQNNNYSQTLEIRTEDFQVPALLNIGVAYVFEFAETQHLTAAFNFQSNTYTDDRYQIGAEYAFMEYFMIRAGLDYSEGTFNKDDRQSVIAGPTFGATFQLPFGEEKLKRLGIDYAYQTTRTFNGNHTIGVTMKL